MGGQDRADPQPRQHGIEVGVRSPTTPQASHGLSDRVVEQTVPCRSLTTPERPDARPRLRQIHELEIQRERGDDRLGIVELKRVKLGLEAPPDIGLFVMAERDRRLAQPLDEIVDRLAGLFGDDLTEERAEETDLERKRIAGATRPDPGRLSRSR